MTRKVEKNRNKEPTRLLWVDERDNILGYTPWGTLTDLVQKELLKTLGEVLLVTKKKT